MFQKVPNINLLPKYERESSRAFYLFIAFIVIVLLSYVILGMYYFTTKSKLASAELEHSELVEEADELQIHVTYLESEVTLLKQSVLFVDNYNIPTSAFIEHLIDLHPKHAYLSEYEYRSQVATITNHFETLDTVADYTTDLTTSAFLKDTKVDEVETFSLHGKEKADISEEDLRYAVNFTMQINKKKLMEGAKNKNE